MKRKMQILIIAIMGFLPSFSSCSRMIDHEEIKSEIKQVERNFQETVKSQGVAEGFYIFAADDAVIKRENDSLITGREAIKNYYLNPISNKAYAEWTPDYIDISDDATLAYTYGKYKWCFTDSSGKISNFQGVFHTVWKKMKDGSWKYVWD